MEHHNCINLLSRLWFSFFICSFLFEYQQFLSIIFPFWYSINYYYISIGAKEAGAPHSLARSQPVWPMVIKGNKYTLTHIHSYLPYYCLLLLLSKLFFFSTFAHKYVANRVVGKNSGNIWNKHHSQPVSIGPFLHPFIESSFCISFARASMCHWTTNKNIKCNVFHIRINPHSEIARETTEKEITNQQPKRFTEFISIYICAQIEWSIYAAIF